MKVEKWTRKSPEKGKKLTRRENNALAQLGGDMGGEAGMYTVILYLFNPNHFT